MADAVAKTKPKSKAKAMGPPELPWHIEVDVYLERAGNNPLFRLHSTMPTNPANEYLIFQNNNRPGFIINFNLIDETNSGFLFPQTSKKKAAVWSRVGNQCPINGDEVWDVFEPLRVINERTTLVVRNDNPSPALGQFKYTLRVTNDDGKSYTELDPGGDDQNGPRTFAR